MSIIFQLVASAAVDRDWLAVVFPCCGVGLLCCCSRSSGHCLLVGGYLPYGSDFNFLQVAFVVWLPSTAVSLLPSKHSPDSRIHWMMALYRLTVVPTRCVPASTQRSLAQLNGRLHRLISLFSLTTILFVFDAKHPPINTSTVIGRIRRFAFSIVYHAFTCSQVMMWQLHPRGFPSSGGIWYQRLCPRKCRSLPMSCRKNSWSQRVSVALNIQPSPGIAITLSLSLSLCLSRSPSPSL